MADNHPGTGITVTFEERVAYIRRARLDGTWTRQAQWKLQRDWNITAEQMVAAGKKANCEITEELGPQEDIRATILAKLHRIVVEGDHRDAIKASEALARLVGVNAPEVDLKTHLKGLSAPDRRAYCLKLINTCQAILDSTPTEAPLQLKAVTVRK